MEGARSLDSNSLPPAGPPRDVRHRGLSPSGWEQSQPHHAEKGGHMLVLLTLEASRPDGASYRLGFGCNLHLAWIVAALSRLF